MMNRSALLLSLYLLLFLGERIQVSAFSQVSSRSGASFSQSWHIRKTEVDFQTTPESSPGFQSPINSIMLYRRPHQHSSSLHSSTPLADVEIASETTTTLLQETSSSSQNGGRSILQAVGLGASDDGLTLRQRIAKMGVCAAMAYSVISQVNSGTTVSVSWFMYASRTGCSPLSPGHWKGYLAFYSGFFVLNNIVRPLRLAAAVALAPRMEQLVVRVQERFDMTRTRATTITAVATYLAALSYSTTCILLASAFSGVAIFPASS